jgi:hypothetical protein
MPAEDTGSDVIESQSSEIDVLWNKIPDSHLISGWV